MAVIDRILSQIGCVEELECYDISIPADPEARNNRSILQAMINSYHAIWTNPAKLFVVPASEVPHSEAHKQGFQSAIYSAP